MPQSLPNRHKVSNEIKTFVHFKPASAAAEWGPVLSMFDKEVELRLQALVRPRSANKERAGRLDDSIVDEEPEELKMYCVHSHTGGK